MFEGRHALPDNEGALFSSFDFILGKAERTSLYNDVLDCIYKGERVGVYVTGLTPALTQFISDAYYAHMMHWNDVGMNGIITLYHYDSVSGTYWEQNV